MLPHILTCLIIYSFSTYLLSNKNTTVSKTKMFTFFGCFNLMGETDIIPSVIYCCRTNTLRSWAYNKHLSHSLVHRSAGACFSIFWDQKITTCMFSSKQSQGIKRTRPPHKHSLSSWHVH